MIIYSIYQLSYFFIIYAVFGWCLEVVYEAVNQRKFINRGFLNGPYCPIYGFGIIIVILCLNSIKDNIIILYFGSVFLTSVLEFFTGFILEKIFHQKWWDYSDSHFNLKGYICLKFSLLWGVACLIAVRMIHPLIECFVNWIPHTLGLVILIILFAGSFSDVIITAFGIMHIKKKIRILDNISAEIQNILDLNKKIFYNTVAGIHEKSEVISDKNDAMRARFENLKAKYKAEYEKKGINRKRIEKAFPHLKINSRKSLKEIFEEFKNNEK